MISHCVVFFIATVGNASLALPAVEGMVVSTYTITVRCLDIIRFLQQRHTARWTRSWN
ncbi:MAG: hypothetical protein ACTHMV_13415 [Chitinophagaceae bacterium]